MHPFWLEIEQLAMEAAKAILPALAGAYLNKSAGIAGAPAITLGNVGRIAGAVASVAVIQHLAAAQAPAVDTAAAPGPIAVAIAGTPAVAAAAAA